MLQNVQTVLRREFTALRLMYWAILYGHDDADDDDGKYTEWDSPFKRFQENDINLTYIGIVQHPIEKTDAQWVRPQSTSVVETIQGTL